MPLLFPFQKLPPELDEKIFGYLGSDMLLESRLVCKDWRNFVDVFMEPKIWKPYFPENINADNLSYFMGTRNRFGTKFTSPRQVEEMMGKYDRYGPLNKDESQQVEAICREIIFQCKSVDEYKSLWQVLPVFVARFGHFIQYCAYYVHDKVPKSVSNIALMMAGMTKLQSLVIYCQDWCYVKRLLNDVIQLPSDLKSLTVRGHWIHLLLTSMFSNSFHHHRFPNVKFLKFNTEMNRQEMENVFSLGLLAFPNMEELKMSNGTYPEILGLCPWPLKRLSVKLKQQKKWDIMFKLGDILESVMKYAGTLECFHLQYTEKDMIVESTMLKKNVVFPKIHDLRLPYCAGLKSDDLLKNLKRIFPNMKHLQLVDSEKEIHHPLIEDLEKAVKSLWEYMPDGMEMISLRYREYHNNGVGGVGGEDTAARCYSYTVHKYFQMKPTVAGEEKALIN